jgi:hypothetical protein
MQPFAKNCREGLLVPTSAHFAAAWLPSLAVLHRAGGWGKSESERLAALERRIEEIGPSIIRGIEERFGDRLCSSPEARRRTEHSAMRPTTQVSSLPRKQEGGEWKVVESRKLKKKRKTAAGLAAK